MIKYKSPAEIEAMRVACRLVADALEAVEDALEPGISTQEIDDLARDFIKGRGGELLFLNYPGPAGPFPANTCISVNHEVVHGIPRPDFSLAKGDLVSVDVGVRVGGYCGDSAWTFPVGEVLDAEVQRLLDVGRESLYRGIRACRIGARISHIGRAIQGFVESHGFHVVKKFVGHGIGKELHEEPQVPNYVETGFLRHDPRLEPGLVLAIEPMVNVGTDDVETASDGWTVVTKDGSLSVHFEHSVAIRAEGPDVLTRRSRESEA